MRIRIPSGLELCCFSSSSHRFRGESGVYLTFRPVRSISPSILTIAKRARINRGAHDLTRSLADRPEINWPAAQIGAQLGIFEIKRAFDLGSIEYDASSTRVLASLKLPEMTVRALSASFLAASFASLEICLFSRSSLSESRISSMEASR